MVRRREQGELIMSDVLSTFLSEIRSVIQDESYGESALIDKINACVNSIAGGILMPDRSISPPLPDLMTYNSVTTSLTLPYVALPADYQRNVFNICDNQGLQIAPPYGGDYYAYNLFLKQSFDMRLTESGSVYRVAVKGTRLYYQGIPTAAETIGLHYYRKPTNMVNDTDTPDGIPAHLQLRLIKHKVCADIFGEAIEDGQDSIGAGLKYHNNKFYEAMGELCSFIGIDDCPSYYGNDNF
jgi:hypothetical protein